MVELTKKKTLGEYETGALAGGDTVVTYRSTNAVGEKVFRGDIVAGTAASIAEGTSTALKMYSDKALKDAVNTGAIPVGTDAEIETGTDTTAKLYAPDQLNSAIDSLIETAVPDGTKAQIITGTDTTERKFTPADINGAVKDIAVAQYAGRTAMKAATGLTAGDVVYLSEGGRSGTFEYLVGDYSAEVAADTLEGVYVKLDAVATTVGVLKRVLNGYVTPEMFGAVGDGVANDSQAINAALLFKKVVLSAKTYNIGGDIIELSGSFNLEGSGSALTTIESKPDETSYPINFHDCLRFTSATDGAKISGLKVVGTVANAGSGVSHIKNVKFSDVVFTTSQDAAIKASGYASTNGLKLTTQLVSGGVENLDFIDCEWVDCGRMGCEIFSSTATTTVQTKNINFIRPKFIRSGRLNAAAGQGLSLDGYAENIIIDSPYFDGNANYQLENIGCSRLIVNDMTINASTLPSGVQPVLYANVLPMYDCEINGLKLVGDGGGATPAAMPEADGVMVFNNVIRFKLANLSWKVSSSGTKAAEFSSAGSPTYYCQDISVTDVDIESDSNSQPITFTNCLGNNKITGKITTSSATAQDAIGVFGSTTIVFDGHYESSYASGIPRCVSTSGAGLCLISNESTLSDPTNGFRSLSSFTDTITISSGSAYSQLSHLLPSGTLSYSLTPLDDVGTGMRWWGGYNSSLINAKTDANVTSDSDFIAKISLLSIP